jgi:hypothetical protein
VAQRGKPSLPKLHDGRANRYLKEEEFAVSSRKVLAAKARENCAQWLSKKCRWDLYATLTYDPVRSGYQPSDHQDERRPPSPAACQRHLVSYHESLSADLGRQCSIAAATELHTSGWPHHHALIGMEGCDTDAFVLASRRWFDKHGFVSFHRVDGQDTAPIASYLVKYFTKTEAAVGLLGPFDSRQGPRQLRMTNPRQPRPARKGGNA